MVPRGGDKQYFACEIPLIFMLARGCLDYAEKKNGLVRLLTNQFDAIGGGP